MLCVCIHRLSQYSLENIYDTCTCVHVYIQGLQPIDVIGRDHASYLSHSLLELELYTAHTGAVSSWSIHDIKNGSFATIDGYEEYMHILSMAANIIPGDSEWYKPRNM